MTGCYTDCKNAKLVIEQFLTRFQQLDSSANELLFNTLSEKELEFQGVQAILAKSMTFDVNKCKKSKEGYNVEVVITTVDFAREFEVLIDGFPENETEEVVLKEISKRISSPDCNVYSLPAAALCIS